MSAIWDVCYWKVLLYKELAIFNIKGMRWQRVLGMPPLVFSFNRIFTINFIDQYNWNVIEEAIMSFTIKMFKEMLLQASLISHVFSVITFIIFPAISKIVYGTTYILLKTLRFYMSKDISSIYHYSQNYG